MSDTDSRGWWRRNWKWFVPTGCVTLLLLILLSCAGVAYLALGLMKKSEVYKMAMRRVQTDPRAAKAFGAPIESGWLVTGNIRISGSSGNADLQIPISGPKGKGTIYAAGVKSAGTWRLTSLKVRLPSNTLIDIVKPADRRRQPQPAPTPRSI